MTFDDADLTSGTPYNETKKTCDHKVTHHTAEVNGIRIHYVEAGESTAPVVVLLHGFPETWFAWRHQIPVLAQHFRVLAPDLRGYGSTSKPASGYDKRTMATDIHQLMLSLGVETAHVVGHDRGARVATRFAKDFPNAVEKLVVVDNIPTLTIFEAMNAEIAQGQWFFLFYSVPSLPEALIRDREEMWLRYTFSSCTYDPEIFEDWEIAAYVAAYRQPGALRGAFSDYQAILIDLAQDKHDRGHVMKTPTLVLWGEDFASGGRMWNFPEVWSKMTSRPTFISLKECGHLPHEEKPDEVNAALLSFLLER